MPSLFLSILILIIGFSFDSTLAALWVSLAILVLLPAGIVFWGILAILTALIFL
jgi:hypothetical protein